VRARFYSGLPRPDVQNETVPEIGLFHYQQDPEVSNNSIGAGDNARPERWVPPSRVFGLDEGRSGALIPCVAWVPLWHPLRFFLSRWPVVRKYLSRAPVRGSPLNEAAREHDAEHLARRTGIIDRDG
jgi:hypothetical protein